jgi:hypothetical protein
MSRALDEHVALDRLARPHELFDDGALAPQLVGRADGDGSGGHVDVDGVARRAGPAMLSALLGALLLLPKLLIMLKPLGK